MESSIKSASPELRSIAMPPGRIVVTESGILSREDVHRMRRGGVQAFLVGEALMRAPDPGAALHDLFFSASAERIRSTP